MVAIAMLAFTVQAAPVLARPGLARPQGAGLAAQGIQTASSKGDGLASSELRETVDRLRHGLSAPQAVDVAGGRVSVEILHQLGQDAVAGRVQRLGGEVKGAVGDGQTLAEVPFDRLAELEQSKGVQFLRPPLRANVLPQQAPLSDHAATPNIASGAVVGEELQKTNAAAWQAAGQTGQGVKIGIVDGFDGNLWDAAAAAGELPQPAGTFCRAFGGNCDLWGFGASHGEGVAEIIHDMAPGATLYLATAITTEDLQAAVDYFASQGVRIISRSLGADYDGPGDGTGPIATVENNAIAAGMAWFNSAGNSAGDPPAHLGAYWRGTWADANSNETLDFAPGDEQLGFICGGVLGLRWSDWGLNPTDYDVFVYDDPNLTVLKTSSLDDQPGGAPPLEHPHPACGPTVEADFLVIRVAPGGGPTTGDTLEFMVNQSALEYSQNPYSAGQPASDTKNPGGVSVGAVDPPLGTNIAFYSSQGPTNDGRMKPDLSAAACVKSFVFSPDCFNGTSAATPVTAGAAALVLGAFPFYTPPDLKSYLLNNASPRGAAGPDNVFGAGELWLPAPPGPQVSGGGVGGSAGGGGSGVSGGSSKNGQASKGQVCNTNIGLSKSARKVRKGAIKLNFSLPRKTYCRVTVTVWESGKKGRLLGQATPLLSGAKGGSLSLKLRINSTGRRKLKRSRRIKAEVFVQAGTRFNRDATAFKSKRIVLKR